MALFGKEARWVGLGVGIGVAGSAAAPFVAPVVAAIARPLTKALLTHGLFALERSRERAAHLLEGLDDILAEVRAQAKETLAERTAAAREAAGDIGQAARTPPNIDAKGVN